MKCDQISLGQDDGICFGTFLSWQGIAKSAICPVDVVYRVGRELVDAALAAVRHVARHGRPVALRLDNIHLLPHEGVP